MKKKFLLFLIINLALFGGFFIWQNQIEKAKAGSTDNVWDWAWSENIGWISFNCIDREADTGKTCLDANDPAFNPAVNLADYGVDIDEDSVSPTHGYFSGYAWSENIGWINFSPAGPYPEAPNFPVRVDIDGLTCGGVGQVCGWATAVSTGWIKLRGQTTEASPNEYGVSIILGSDPKEFEGWAWGGNIMGWISFNTVEAEGTILVLDGEKAIRTDAENLTSLQLDTSGNPVVAYYIEDTANSRGYINLIHCNDPYCLGGDESLAEIDEVGYRSGTASGNENWSVSLQLDTSGNPVIAYHMWVPDEDLMLARCSDPDCQGSISIETVDSYGDTGSWGASLKLDPNSYPVISYNAHYDSFSRLKLAHCNDVNCDPAVNGTESIQEVDSEPSAVPYLGEQTSHSLQFDSSGFPVIVYRYSGGMKLAHCNDVNCDPAVNGAESVNIVEDGAGGGCGGRSSLELDSIGNPVISCSSSGLKLVRCNDSNCAGGDEQFILIESGNFGSFTSLALDNNIPVIAYRKGGSDGDLKLVRCNDSACNSWGVPNTIDNPYYNVGRGISLQLDGSNPVISYWDLFNNNLKFAHCSDPNCDPGTTDYKVMTSFNLPPYKPQSVGDGETWNHCSIEGLSIPTFHWTYSDPEGNPQAAYEIWVDDDPNFPDPKFNHLVEPSASTDYALDLFQDDDSPWITELEWGSTYYWKVKVKDDHNNWSVFSDFDSFTLPSHAYGGPDFTHLPLIPSIDEVVRFTDKSKCYSSPGNIEYDCKKDGGAAIQYEWDFDYIAPVFTEDSIQKGDTTTTYSVQGNYEVRLKITDDTLSPPGACIGQGDSPIGATLPPPEWKEIPPFIWLNKLFAGVLKFLNGFLL